QDGTNDTPFREVADRRSLPNGTPRDAVGASVFASLDRLGFVVGPAVRYRRWLSSAAALDIAAGTPLLTTTDIQSGSVFGLVRWSPNDWFAVAARPELVRRSEVLACGPTTCASGVRSRARVSLGLEFGRMPGLALTGAARVAALRILKTVPLIDGHNDIPDAIRERGGLDSVDFGVLQQKLMSDIPKLRAGGVGAQFWAAYVPVTTMDSGPHPAVYALEQIDLLKRLCAKYPRDLAMAYRAADVERDFTAGKISCLIGIEGGHAIENSLGALRMFAALGVRYITLTHWRSLSWATASTDTARRGLSPFGRDVVHEMNRLGIVVDLSHVNDATMSDALHTTRAP